VHESRRWWIRPHPTPPRRPGSLPHQLTRRPSHASTGNSASLARPGCPWRTVLPSCAIQTDRRDAAGGDWCDTGQRGRLAFGRRVEPPAARGEKPGGVSVSLPHRFHGTVSLDPARVGRDASRVASEAGSETRAPIGAPAPGDDVCTVQPGIPPSELVTAVAMRHALPEFLADPGRLRSPLHLMRPGETSPAASRSRPRGHGLPAGARPAPSAATNSSNTGHSTACPSVSIAAMTAGRSAGSASVTRNVCVRLVKPVQQSVMIVCRVL
jgi:hypothetical protein